jgi:hypothetical protein
MNAALRKEARLIMPAWIAALLAATLPVWVMGADLGWMEQMSYIFFTAGALLLSLASFGLEMSLGTFPSLLAQPRPRLEIWRMKIGLLAAALAVVVAAACLSWVLRLHTLLAVATLTRNQTPGYLYYMNYMRNFRPDFRSFPLLAAMAFAGGLWTTLLFRQIVTSFWFAFLVPLVLYNTVWPQIEDIFAEVDSSFLKAALGFAICVYATVGYFLARWLFLHAQVKQAQEATDPVRWSFLPAFPMPRRPVTALLVKELRLQQGTLLISVGLVLLHLAAVAVAEYFPALLVKYPSLLTIFMVWMMVPLVVGCASFAEERRAQTLQNTLCLPIGVILQFFIKLLVVFGLGIFLGAVMPWLLDQLRPALGWEKPSFKGLLIAATIITAIGCYASSLSGALLQAIGAAIGATSGIFLMLILVADFFPFKNRAVTNVIQHDWWPVLIATGVCLSYGNFKQLRITWRQWLRNGLALLAVLSTVCFIVSYVYA